MKAIKIASGVAVSALAAAISAQAGAAEMADTETSWSFTGSMEAVYIIDMQSLDANNKEATVMDVDLDEGDDYDSATAGEAWGMNIGMDVNHGPLSATLNIEMDDNSNGDNIATVSIDDIVVTDGAVSFGQVGSLIETDDYAYDMGDSGDDFNSASEGLDVEAGIRYTKDNLAVQVEGLNDPNGIDTTDAINSDATGTQYGLGAKYSGEADALSYVVDAQFRGSDQSPDGTDAYTYVGAGVTYTTDMVTVMAGLNNWGQSDKVTEYGVEVTVTPMDALSVYAKAQDYDAADTVETDTTNQMKALFGGAYTAGMITATVEYTYTAIENGGDELFGELAYADGPIGAYADVTLGNLDADESDDPQMGAGVSYTKDNGVKYAADFDFQTDVENKLVLSAAYAF